MTEKDNEKLSMEEMEETAGGGILDSLKGYFDNIEYTESKCPSCGEIIRTPKQGFAGIPTCSKCRRSIYDLPIPETLTPFIP